MCIGLGGSGRSTLEHRASYPTSSSGMDGGRWVCWGGDADCMEKVASERGVVWWCCLSGGGFELITSIGWYIG